MTRIVYVIATLDRGGSESQMVRLATGLDRSRFDPVVICLTRGGPLEARLSDARVTTVILKKRRKLDLSVLRRLTDLFRLFGPDIVHTWLFTSNFYGRWAALRAAVPHLVASERSTDDSKPWLNRRIDRWLAPRTDRFVANCEAVRRVCLDRLGVSDDRIVVIPNGLESARIPAGVREEFRAREGLPEDALLFVTAGRLDRTKAVDDIIRAFATVAPEFPASYLVVIGGGVELDGLARLVAELGLAERVLFLGEVPDPGGVLAASDVFVFASLYEGLPNAVLEAMGAGLPVVATDVGGIPEVVTDGEAGHLVPVRRPDQLAKRMLELARDPELRRRLGEVGRARVAEFTVERMVGAYEALYDEVRAAGPGATTAP